MSIKRILLVTNGGDNGEILHNVSATNSGDNDEILHNVSATNSGDNDDIFNHGQKLSEVRKNI